MQILDQKTRIEKIAETGYDFKFEKYFSEAWALFRLKPGPFVLYAILVFALSIGVSIIPILGSLVIGVIGPALTAGYYVAARKLDTTSQLEIGDFFKSFDFLLQLFLMALISGLLVVLGFILLILPGIWFAIAVVLGYPMVVLAKLDFWESIKLSAKVVTKRWFHFFGFLILIVFLNILGVIALGVGLLITVPVSYLAIYSAFKDIIGFDEPGTMDTTEHLVDETT